MNNLRKFSDRHVLAICFFITVFLAVVLLVIGAFLPQDRIVQNVKESAAMISSEGNYPSIIDRTGGSTLDNYTDTLILAYSCETKAENISSIFTNPSIYQSGDVADSLLVYNDTDTPEITGNYVRYWMGFRPFVRLLLTILNFWQIRRYLIVTVYTLFLMVICSVAKQLNEKIAFLFGISIVMIRLHIVAQSMQFSIVFLIAFLAMLLVPFIYKNKKYETLFFMELGMITMYFDFYTVPIITIGLPLIYLYCLRTNNNDAISVKQIVLDFSVWLMGYVFMWISKLVLTTLLTDVNAIESGLGSLFYRLGIQQDISVIEQYDSVKALQSVFEIISGEPDKMGKKILLIFLGFITVFVVARFVMNKQPIRTLGKYTYFLLIALFPIVWFMVAAQPTNIHAFFQYRGICVAFWGVMTYVFFTLNRKQYVPMV